MKKVVIVGAGEIGAFIAERLAAEHMDVTVMDENPDALSTLRSKLDVAAVQGNGASLADLIAAGAQSADLFIAATNWDETNLIICLLAHELKIPNKIAVTRMISANPAQNRFDYTKFGIDLIVNTNEALRDEMLGVVESPGVSELATFADGNIILIGHQVGKKSNFLGKTVREATGEETESFFHVAAAVRDRELIEPEAQFRLEEDDYVYLITTAELLPILKTMLQVESIRSRSAVIYGDNRLAQLLAAGLLNRHFRVTMLAESGEKARQIRESFANRRQFAVEVGSGTEIKLLKRVNVAESSAFFATTPDDATNFTACVAAKYLGVGKTIANIRRDDILPLSHSAGVDVVVAPRLAAAKVIQKAVHEERLLDYRAVGQTNLEVVEVEAGKGCKAASKSLGELKLPDGVIIGGIVSNGDSSLPTPQSRIHARDKVIVLTLPERLLEVEALFAGE
jgi:trk system potassium uptake protein TrkA